MPYIKQERRNVLDSYIDNLSNELQEMEFNEGDLNYVITRLILDQWAANQSYATGNRLIGVLECAKQEFYRMQLGPYELTKRRENGKV